MTLGDLIQWLATRRLLEHRYIGRITRYYQQL